MKRDHDESWHTVTIRIPRALVSPNKWNGMHWRKKHRLSQEWEKDIWASVLTSGLPKAAFLLVPKKRVSVIREVPNVNHFIRDDDNLRFSVKPLLDALKRQGLIVDDSREHIELTMPEQKVSVDGQHWTEIRLEAAI